MISYVYTESILYGAQILGIGWSFRNGGSQINARDAGKPVFDFKYDKKNTVSNGGRSYLYPDNANVYALGDHVYNKTSFVYSSYHEAISESMRGWSISLGIDIGKYAIEGKYARTEYDMRHHIEIENKAVALGVYTSSIYRIVGPWYVISPLYPDLRAAFDMIPSVPRTHEDLYIIQSIIDTWGEMFVASADFGLKLQYAGYINRKYIEDVHVHTVTSQFSISVRKDLWDLTVRYDDIHGDLTLDKRFIESTSTEIYFIGGDRSKQMKNSLAEWDDSLTYDNARVIRAQLVLLSNLISWDTTKRKELESILIRYCNTGILQASNGVVFSLRDYLLRGSYQLFPLGRSLPSIIPGAQIIGSTFDPLKMTYGINVLQSLPVKDTWINPIYKNISFLVPRTVYVQDTPESYEYSSVFLSHAYLDYTHQMERRYTDSYAWGLGKHSHYEYQYLKHLWSQMSIGIRRSQMIEWYRLSLSPSVAKDRELSLLPEVRNYILSLPCTYHFGEVSGHDRTEENLYDHLISSLGPEVIIDVRMGGGINLNTVINLEILNYLDINYVIDQSGIDLVFLKMSSSEEYRNQNLNMYYRRFSKTYIDINGGYWSERNRTQIEPWESYRRTIADAPQPIEKRTVPLSYFVSDPCRRQAILSAIHRYYNTTSV